MKWKVSKRKRDGKWMARVWAGKKEAGRRKAKECKSEAEAEEWCRGMVERGEEALLERRVMGGGTVVVVKRNGGWEGRYSWVEKGKRRVKSRRTETEEEGREWAEQWRRRKEGEREGMERLGEEGARWERTGNEWVDGYMAGYAAGYGLRKRPTRREVLKLFVEEVRTRKGLKEEIVLGREGVCDGGENRPPQG